jgi:hypothetical protein
MDVLTTLTVIGNLILTIGGIIGGYIFVKSSSTKASLSAKDSVINSLQVERDILNDKIQRLDTDLRKIKRMLLLIVRTLKKSHGLELSINDEYFTVSDRKGTQISARLEDDD